MNDSIVTHSILTQRVTFCLMSFVFLICYRYCTKLGEMSISYVVVVLIISY